MARTTTKHAIVLRMANPETGVTQKEAISSGTLYPGYLGELSSGAIQAHSTGTGVLPMKLIALENPTPDTNTYPTTAQIDIPYDNGNICYYAVAQPGERYNMYLAASMTATAGTTVLCSNGDGTLRTESVDANTLAGSVVGVAANSVTTVGSALRIQVDIT